MTQKPNREFIKEFKIPEEVLIEKKLKRSEREELEKLRKEKLTEIESFIKKFKKPELLIGFGEVADVYKDPKGSIEKEVKKMFCLKHIARITKKRAYEIPLEKEMEMQTIAWHILEKKAETEPNLSIAKIPIPEFYVETDDGNEYFVMEQINGKTLNHLILENFAKTIPKEYYLTFGITQLDEISKLSEKDLDQLIFQIYGLKRETAYRNIMGKLEKTPFLPPEIALQVSNAIKILNNEQFFHRDLHEKNLMITNDLKQAYIIDFAQSTYKEFTHETAYEVFREGERLIYTRDPHIMSTLRKLIKS